MGQRDAQRRIPCQVLTPAGWIIGTFHIMKTAKFVDQLNFASEFFRLTDVSFIGKEKKIPFFALQRVAATLVVPPPTEGDLIVERHEEKKAVRVHCIFDSGVVSGDLVIRENIRISDYLVKQDGYILLRRCKLRLGNLQDEFFVEEKHPSVIVYAPNILGFSEDEPFAD